MKRAGLAVLTAYAAFGLALSLGVHLWSFFGPPPGGDGLFFALHIGIFPLWLPVALIAKQMSGSGRFDWKALLARAPAPLRYMTKGFFAYAILNFAFFFLTTLGQPHVAHATAPPDNVWRGFSGHWMAFYSVGLTIAATAWLRGAEPPRCPNGHSVGLDDAFCPRCGKPIARVS